MRNDLIDCGEEFDWGRTSLDYAVFRDIYPEQFFDRIIQRGLCVAGQDVLDVGTGTGVLPRAMLNYGAHWTGIDVAEAQIEQARLLSKGTCIDYYTLGAEDLRFPNDSFDIITACQCFSYFDHSRAANEFARVLRPGGRLIVLYMAWLPFESRIALESEKLVLRHNPYWSGSGETMRPVDIPEDYNELFDVRYHTEFPLKVHFTRAGWHGRMKACRGVGASLNDSVLRSWESEHQKLLNRIAPDEFDIAHYGAIAELEVKG